MAYSSIVGADQAPTHPSGRDSEALGPSDSSDTGSDAQGTREAHGDSDASGTGERGTVSGTDAKEGGDIMPDRVVQVEEEELSGFPEADPDSDGFTNLDGDGEGDIEQPGGAGER